MTWWSPRPPPGKGGRGTGRPRRARRDAPTAAVGGGGAVARAATRAAHDGGAPRLEPARTAAAGFFWGLDADWVDLTCVAGRSSRAGAADRRSTARPALPEAAGRPPSSPAELRRGRQADPPRASRSRTCSPATTSSPGRVTDQALGTTPYSARSRPTPRARPMLPAAGSRASSAGYTVECTPRGDPLRLERAVPARRSVNDLDQPVTVALAAMAGGRAHRRKPGRRSRTPRTVGSAVLLDGATPTRRHPPGDPGRHRQAAARPSAGSTGLTSGRRRSAM